MRFVPHHRLGPEERARAVAVDGACAAALQLAHWPGNATPPRWKADLGVEMALHYAEDPDPRLAIATTDHHDADAVLSLFALQQPDLARAHRGALVAAAALSDFQHGRDVGALQLATVLDHGRGAGSPEAEAEATSAALARLPAVLQEGPAPFEALWRDEVGWFEVSREALGDGALRVTELPAARLSVLEWDAECHPAVADGAARGDLLLHVIQGPEGFHYRADWRGYAWAETVSPQRPPIARVGLEKLCLPLNSLETNRRGRWMDHGYAGRGRTEALRFTTPMGEELESHLQPTEVVQKLAWFLMDRGGRAP